MNPRPLRSAHTVAKVPTRHRRRRCRLRIGDHALLGRCIGKGKAQRKTQKAEQEPHIVKISHPHHPLYGKQVVVVRQLNVVKGGEERWVIEDETLGHISIPQTWVEAVESNESLQGNVEPRASERQVSKSKEHVQVNVEVLLNLAKLVEDLQKKQSHQGASHVNEAARKQADDNRREQSSIKAPPRGGNQCGGMGEAAGRAAQATGAASGPTAAQSRIPTSDKGDAQ